MRPSLPADSHRGLLAFQTRPGRIDSTSCLLLYILVLSYRRNEELDDKVVIRKLKQRVAELEAEISSLRDHNQYPTALPISNPAKNSSSFARPLSETDRQHCHQILHDFFHGKIDNPVAAGGYCVATECAF